MKLLPDQGELLEVAETYEKLVEKVKRNYLTVTRPDITFAVSVVSQFLSTLKTTHLKAIIRILKYLKTAPRRGLFYSDHEHTQVAGFSNADWARRPQDILSYLEKILCHEKTRSSLWSLSPMQSQRTGQ